jgi:hypothetical protein
MPGTTTAGREDRKENVLHVHYNFRYSYALRQDGVDSNHRQPDDYLREPHDQISKFSQRDALAAMIDGIARAHRITNSGAPGGRALPRAQD